MSPVFVPRKAKELVRSITEQENNFLILFVRIYMNYTFFWTISFAHVLIP